MDIYVKHNLPWYKGGTELDEVIRKFAVKCKLRESRYSEYNPNSDKLEFEGADKKQFTMLKNKLKRSKKLEGIQYEIYANNVT